MEIMYTEMYWRFLFLDCVHILQYQTFNVYIETNDEKKRSNEIEISLFVSQNGIWNKNIPKFFQNNSKTNLLKQLYRYLNHSKTEKDLYICVCLSETSSLLQCVAVERGRHHKFRIEFIACHWHNLSFRSALLKLTVRAFFWCLQFLQIFPIYSIEKSNFFVLLTKLSVVDNKFGVFQTTYQIFYWKFIGFFIIWISIW